MPGDAEKLREKFSVLQNQAKTAKIVLSDDGTFNGRGLVGKFKITDERVEVDLKEKPWGTFDWMIKDKLESLIADALL
jgi:hypothetical protein